jgi:hypothetical protein
MEFVDTEREQMDRNNHASSDIDKLEKSTTQELCKDQENK